VPCCLHITRPAALAPHALAPHFDRIFRNDAAPGRF